MTNTLAKTCFRGLAVLVVVTGALLLVQNGQIVSPAQATAPSCITGAVYGDGTGWAQNDCSTEYNIGIASYKKVDNQIHTQILFRSKVVTINPGERIGRNKLAIGVPDCDFQIDLFVGSSPLEPPFYTDLIDAKDISNGGFCASAPPIDPPAIQHVNLTAASQCFVPGQTVSASWNRTSGDAYNADWIAIVFPGMSYQDMPAGQGDWRYWDGTNNLPANTPPANGTVSIPVPSANTSSNIQLVYYENGIYTERARTASMPRCGALPPTADIKANGLDGPITIPSGTPATISWTSQNATACTVSPNGWSGTSGSQSSGNLSASQTYTVVCSNASGQTATDSVTVNVTQSCVAPTITTLAATNISQSSATLNATVNSGSQQTTVWFEYGTTTAFGSVTPRQILPANTTTNVSASVSGLQANTTYFFKVMTTNECGGANISGAILTFTTGGGSTPTVDIKANGLDGPITIQSGTSATLTWTSQNTTACTVVPGNYTGTNNMTGQSTGNLTSNQTYTITCTGTNGQTVTDSVTINITSSCVTPVISTIAATNITQTSATLNATVNSGSQQTTVWFEYGTTTAFGQTTATQNVPANTTINVFANISGLQPNTTYFFRIVAMNGCGGSNVLGAILTLITGQGNTPTADIKANGQDGQITIQSGTAATISWTSQNATACTVSPNGWSGTSGSQSSGNLSASQTYTVVCSNASGQTATDSVTVNVTQSCVAPTVITTSATNITQTSATLTGIITPGGQSTTVYFEYGTSSSLGTTAGSQTVSGTSPVQVQTVITGLQANTLYYFRLVAVNSCGGSNVNGSILTFQTTGGGATPSVDIRANGQDGVLTVQYNTAATISWTSQNTVSCSISPNGWTGTNGSQSSGNITTTVTYTATCVGTNGQTVQDSVVVQPSGYTLPTVVLTANPTVISQGQSSVLSWYSTNASYCYASSGPWSGTKTLSGSETVSPTITSTYYITCTNSYGSASDPETVTVTSGGTGGGSIQVSKYVRNTTNGQTSFTQTVEAQGMDVLEFEIRVRNNDSYARTITVQDILPSELYYVTGSTTVNGSTVSDGITTNGLNLGYVNANEEKIVRFRAIVFYGTTERTVTNQATATGVSGGYGTGFATVNIRNRGTVLGAADIVTGSNDGLALSVIIGFFIALALYIVGKKRGWYKISVLAIKEKTRDIEDVLATLAKKAQTSYEASHGRSGIIN